MAPTSRTFRIFVSSTFSDLKAERNALQERVFPELRKLCEQHGARFQPIDLRWGVSEEASLDQQAMNICLGEIARCQQASPRPNFIVLLGDRYGWCPPAAQIPDEEFQQILGAVGEDEKALLREWYALDENALPHEWRLKPRQKGSEYTRSENWQPVELQLHTILEAAAKKLPLKEEARLPFIASATEQEIAAGALRVKEAPEHVFCFFRSIEGLPQEFKATEFQALVAARLKEEYPNSLSASCQALVQSILEMGPNSSARDFADHIGRKLGETLKTTPEEDILNFIRQALADCAAKDFLNLDENTWIIDKPAFGKQNQLKGLLQGQISSNVYSYPARWTGSGITTDHLEQFCKDVYTSLSRIILAEIEHPHEAALEAKGEVHIRPDRALDDEGLAHHKFAEERLRFFVGRTEMLAKIADYLRNSAKRSLVIVGAGGTGKSALTAKAIEQTQQAQSGAARIYRFIGATPASSDGRSLLESLCHEISRCYRANEAEIPMDYRDLVPELGKRMQLATAEKPLVIFLDSLDQLSASQGARSLVWLPGELPPYVSVIVTTREEDTFENLKAKSPRLEVLAGLSQNEGDELLSQWLADIHRTLQPSQRSEIMDKFMRSGGNPLYLKLALEEARLWTSYQPQEELATGVNGIIEKNMIDRLKDESNHGDALVSHALGYLAASRFGLAEDELVDLLSRDVEVYEWFFRNSYHLPADLIQQAIQYRRDHAINPGKMDGEIGKDEERVALAWLKEIRNLPEQVFEFLKEVLPKADGPRLPVVLWSRVSFDLTPYLTERMVDGSTLLNFYHRELGDVSTAVFLSEGKDKPYHARLADYFRFKADPASDRTWNGNSRHGLSELPYHLTLAEDFDGAYQTLTDFKFLEHKAAEVGVLVRKDGGGTSANTYTGVLQLQEDYERALAAMPGGEGGMGDRAPLILTALETSKGLMVYCPVCNKYSPVEKKMLNTVIACPQEACKAPIKLNPFTVKREV